MTEPARTLYPPIEPFKTGMLDTGEGHTLYWELCGNPNGKPAVFLHGGPGADYRNGLNVKQLADAGYYVVFYDQRGSGLSKRHPSDIYTINLMTDDLKAVIQHYRRSATQKIFLFGSSNINCR